MNSPKTVAKIQRFAAFLLIFSALALAATTGTGFRSEVVIQAVQARYGSAAGSVATDWNAVLNLFQGESEEKKLNEVNEYFNRKLRFVDDQANWGQNDYWATPIEALLKGAGDCEDFAIAKYFSLKFIGVPTAKLRITYVKARIGGPYSTATQAHMVLTYYATPDAEPTILDNLISEIRPASRRGDLIPIFSFNSEGVWAAGSTTPQPGGGSRLSRWNDLMEKMKSEGFD